MKNILTTLFWVALITGTFFFLFLHQEKTIENLFLSLGISGLYTFIIGLGNYCTNAYLNTRYSWVENTKKRTVSGIIATLLVNVILVLICNYINFIWIHNQDSALFFKGAMALSNWFIINISLLISAILHARGFAIAWKDASKSQVVEQKLIANSADAQFESLKNQLDPHFLFNSLNVLTSLIEENPVQAQLFTTDMSKIYRYILEQKNKELVTIAEEIEFSKSYTHLLKTRFEDSVFFEFDVKDSDLPFFVVPLSLQLLLENCIKHNFATSSKPLNIKIYTKGSYLYVVNNLQEREQIKNTPGIGLSNIVKRYSLITDKNVFVEKTNNLFKVKIPILTSKK